MEAEGLESCILLAIALHCTYALLSLLKSDPDGCDERSLPVDYVVELGRMHGSSGSLSCLAMVA